MKKEEIKEVSLGDQLIEWLEAERKELSDMFTEFIGSNVYEDFDDAVKEIKNKPKAIFSDERWKRLKSFIESDGDMSDLKDLDEFEEKWV